MLKLDRSNIQSFCRTCLNCLQSAEESVTASSVKYNIRETPNLTKLLILCTTLNINEDADAAYPQQVCHKCYMSLLEIQRFRDLALQSNDVLRRVVENADAVVVTQNENSTQHEQLTRTKCEDFSNDHFEASQTELSESYFVIQEKEIEYDEFLDNSSEIKIEPAMFGDDSCVSPALSVAAKVIDCSADIVDDASTSTAGTSTAGTKRKRYLGPWECPVEDCGVEFDTKKALEKHSKYVHSAAMLTPKKTAALPKKAAAAKEIKFEAFLGAIKDILLRKKAIRTAAREYDVNRITLTRHAKKVVDHVTDISTVSDVDLLEFIRISNMNIPSNMVFSLSQENDLVKYIQKCVNHYYGLSRNKLMELAYQLAVKLQVDYPVSWNDDSMAGHMWYRGFMRRHPELTLKTPEQTSLNRVKSFCKENVDKFFANLGRLLDKHHFDSTCIYNMDEIGFSTVPTKIGEVIDLKSMRRVGKLKAAERGPTVTMALTVSASGHSIPPYFLFPHKSMQACFLDNATSGAAGYANDSGWMCQLEFVRFIEHFINFVKPAVASPVLLLLDNHTSHLSVDALDLAAARGVHILSFPPHCSHKLQPLDVSVFGPVKTYYKSQCSAWQENNANKVLEIRHIAGLVCTTLDLALTPKTMKSGFSATGIHPFNPDIFTDADFVQAVEVNAREVQVDAHLGEDEQRKIIFD